MSETDDPEYRKRLHKLVAKQQAARMPVADRWGLVPVEAGWLRGSAYNVRQSETICEFGTLQVLEFDLVPAPGEPGVPVRMDGTYFTNRLIEGQVLDVPDPTPDTRPVSPRQIFYAHSNRTIDLMSYYPGRDAMTKRKGATMGLLALGGPVVVLVLTLLVLHFGFHVF
jgi:hypothetical protein